MAGGPTEAPLDDLSIFFPQGDIVALRWIRAEMQRPAFYLTVALSVSFITALLLVVAVTVAQNAVPLSPERRRHVLIKQLSQDAHPKSRCPSRGSAGRGSLIVVAPDMASLDEDKQLMFGSSTPRSRPRNFEPLEMLTVPKNLEQDFTIGYGSSATASHGREDIRARHQAWVAVSRQNSDTVDFSCRLSHLSPAILRLSEP